MPAGTTKQKVQPRLDKHARAFIEASPFMLSARRRRMARATCRPKGGPPGFVVDTRRSITSPIPDLAGNNLLDSITNIVNGSGHRHAVPRARRRRDVARQRIRVHHHRRCGARCLRCEGPSAEGGDRRDSRPAVHALCEGVPSQRAVERRDVARPRHVAIARLHPRRSDRSARRRHRRGRSTPTSRPATPRRCGSRAESVRRRACRRSSTASRRRSRRSAPRRSCLRQRPGRRCTAAG